METELTFETSVARRHRNVDPDEWDDVYVVGDVHGCLDALDRLLAGYDDGATLFVFVGDLVRKGPESKGVVDRVRNAENLVTVAGNNERKIVRGEKSVAELTSDDEAWLASLPVVVSVGPDLVVHGGVDHRKPLAEHAVEELLTRRSLHPDGGYERPYWFERRTDGRRVFFGHTVLAEPFATPWAVGLDTGCVYGGELTAFRWSTGEFVSVEPSATYRSRSDDNIVEPTLASAGDRS